jgi:NhaP-type Na+/H+ or K+/H+ antiporter
MLPDAQPETRPANGTEHAMLNLMVNPGLAIAVILALGAAAQWLAWRINLPAILPLLITGFMLGPVLGLVDPLQLVGQELLFPAISLAVSLILFEGGLTLRLPELREVGTAVRRLVSLGAVISWLLIAVAGYFIAGLDAQLSLLFGALLMVTGPTVIGPLLRIVRPIPRIANVLKWEGIVIDPIGAMVAVLVFTWLVHAGSGDALNQTLLIFGRFILVGSVIGVIAGFAMAALLKRRQIPDFLVNLIALAFVFLAFAVSNMLASESGLLATTLMGIIIANTSVPNFRSILSFKEDLSVLVISVLFIVLAANIQLDTLLQVTSLRSLLLLAVIMLVVRPLSIFASTAGTDFTFKEKLYLSWIAPRGIVAASVSSLFAARLAGEGFAGAPVLVPLVFLVIVGTVLLNSVTALPLARLLGVAEPDPQGFLLLGAHPFAREIARYLQENGFAVLLTDTNWVNVSAAHAEGLRAYYGSLLSDRADYDVRLSGLGKLLALTSNDEANALTAVKYARVFGSHDVYQLEPDRSSGERGRVGNAEGGRNLGMGGATYSDLQYLFDQGARMTETQITEEFDGEDFAERHGSNFVALFSRSNGKLKVLTEDSAMPEPGTTLVTLLLEAGGTRA